MALGKVEICGVNTAKLPLLKAAEKEALFRQIEEGDKAARETYIEGNLRLVLSVIKRFSSSRSAASDLSKPLTILTLRSMSNFPLTPYP